MCLILIASQVSKQWPLVVLGNRDEFYSRPTAPLAVWEEDPGVMAGKDLQSGGTWMGVHRNGRWAAVTNFREPDSSPGAAKSRGWLVRDFLLGNWFARDYLEKIADEAEEYAGFHLLAGDRQGLWHFSNRQTGLSELPPGFYGVSNGRFNADWPKARNGKQRLADLLEAADWQVVDAFQLMADESRAPDAQLPATGVPLEWERALSAIFIVTPVYGTRSTSIYRVAKNGQASFSERHFTRPPHAWQETRYDWSAFLDEKA